MTKDAVIDVVHKTIYGFLDVVADDSEEPINEKDKLLLEVNKAICNAIKEMPDDERKTGKWIFGETMGHSWMKCSECCVSQDGQTACFTYCPNCGAKMEGADNEKETVLG